MTDRSCQLAKGTVVAYSGLVLRMDKSRIIKRTFVDFEIINKSSFLVIFLYGLRGIVVSL